MNARGGMHAPAGRQNLMRGLERQQHNGLEGGTPTTDASFSKDLQTLETLLTIDDQISQRPGASGGECMHA